MSDESTDRVTELLLLSRERPLTEEEQDDFTLHVGVHCVAVFMRAGLTQDDALAKVENLMYGDDGCRIDAKINADGQLEVSVTRGDQ